MKTSSSALFSLVLGASMVYAAFEPVATMDPRSAHHKRQKDGAGLDLSAILANPSSYLAQASAALANPSYASAFSKVTANPDFQSSISEALVSQFGSETASIALQQYTAALNTIAPSATGANNDATAGGDSAAVPSASPSTSSGGTQQVSGSQNGASSTFAFALVGTAMSLGAAAVLVAL